MMCVVTSEGLSSLIALFHFICRCVIHLIIKLYKYGATLIMYVRVSVCAYLHVCIHVCVSIHHTIMAFGIRLIHPCIKVDMLIVGFIVGQSICASFFQLHLYRFSSRPIRTCDTVRRLLLHDSYQPRRGVRT